MAKRIIWSANAKHEKKEILKYWLKRNKSKVYPEKLNFLIDESIKWIVENSYPRRKTDVKDVFLKRVRDYFIVFQEDESTVYILSIWDMRQDPESLLRRLK